MGLTGLLGLLAARVAGGLARDVPVDPGAGDARRQLLEELAKSEYQQARPSWFDLLAQAISDWLQSLQVPLVDGGPSLLPLVVGLVAVVVIVVAFLIFGVPRLNRRSAITGTLFGENDERDAEALRRSAEAAHAAGDYATATSDMFRALARGLAERVIVTTTPGTTATGFATEAAVAFPDHAAELATSAARFDEVRYLGQPGTEAGYRTVADLEAALRTSRRTTEAAPA